MSTDATLDNEAIEREEEIARGLHQCRLMLDRIGPSARVVEPSSTAALHWLDTGHIMAAGCCLNHGGNAVKEV